MITGRTTAGTLSTTSVLARPAHGDSKDDSTAMDSNNEDTNMDRRLAFRRMGALAAFTGLAGTTWPRPRSSWAVNDDDLAANLSSSATTTSSNNPSKMTDKLVNLSNDELANRIRADVVDRQFLVTAQISRDLYDESAIFTDEIDAYPMDKWITGTQRLFVASKSQVDLEPNSLTVDKDVATFRFSEYLCFNIPVFQPIVYLSGKVILRRDPSNGLITSYQEVWDQDVSTVLKSAKFFG